MSVDLLMPKLGLTMTEGSVSEWKVDPGGEVRAGEVVVVIETEKVAYDVEAEVDGTLLAIDVPVGETVPVGARLARIGVHAETLAEVDAEPTPARESEMRIANEDPVAIAAKAVGPARTDGRIVATPLARKLAAGSSVDLRAVAGSGPRGRIKADDVRKAATSEAATPPASAAPAAGRRRPSPTQATMARRLSAVKHGVPHFYLATEVELSALEALRANLNADTTRPRLSITAFIVAAVGRALNDQPSANTVWADDELLSYGSADVGIAVHTAQGLFVPVVRDVGAKPLDRIAREAGELIERTRAGTLSLDDMTGGAITVSNAGMHDVTYITPIVSPGQSAILGVGSVRPVFRPDADGKPVLRRELGLVLAADHRIFDGVSGIELLNRIVGYLESPLSLSNSG